MRQELPDDNWFDAFEAACLKRSEDARQYLWWGRSWPFRVLMAPTFPFLLFLFSGSRLIHASIRAARASRLSPPVSIKEALLVSIFENQIAFWFNFWGRDPWSLEAIKSWERISILMLKLFTTFLLLYNSLFYIVMGMLLYDIWQ